MRSVPHLKTIVNPLLKLLSWYLRLCQKPFTGKISGAILLAWYFPGLLPIAFAVLIFGLVAMRQPDFQQPSGQLSGPVVTPSDGDDTPGYFAFPKGLSDGTYLNAPKTEPPKTANIGAVKGGKFDPHKHLTAVRGVELYASTLVTKRGAKLAHEHEHKRGEILNLSGDSLGRLAFVAFNTPAHFASMMTLTFADVITDGKQVKKSLNAFLSWYRRNHPGALYLWWLEFQRRGAPHYHLLSTVDLGQFGPAATIHRDNGETWLTHWDTWQMLEKTWANLGGGMTAWEVINDAEGGKKYAAKYATKAYQKAVPPAYRNVGRFWGHSQGGVKPEPTGFYECSEEQLRAALSRGGWEHLPDDEGIIYRELFQAAQAIDLTQLTPVSTLELPKEEPARPILPAELWPTPARPGQSGYTCTGCGVVSSKWAGQCPACGEWDTLTRQDL